ncbi:unnamed protein product [Allacma fusca]|uniref:O-acyltransferase WSD1-like N-terminal domain-containing protein n=1 Tax=Allacma fusca TaxID=39272 RepID=A0A8J2JMH2_9HEXA|nr:unnamed protein product [Allacma fusca]
MVIPPTILTYILNHLIVRSCLKIYLQIRFGGKLKLVNDSGDAMFGYKSEGNNRNILIALECKKFKRFQHRKDQATNLLNLKVGRIKPYEKLRWIFTKHAGYFCWKYDDNFNLENHLIDISPENVINHEQLIQIIEEHSRDMSDEHPQWQFLFVPNYINEDGQDLSAIVTRFHHGILDGLSFVTFVSHCLGAIAPDSDDEPFAQACPETFPYVLNPLKFFIPLKYRILYNINCLLFGFYHLLQTLMSDKKHWNVTEKYPGKSKSYAFSEKIQLETLKVIRESCRVSVASILASSFAKALENTVGSRLPPNKILVGHSLAILPYPDGYFHNRFTLMTVPFKRSNKMTRIEKLKVKFKILFFNGYPVMIG